MILRSESEDALTVFGRRRVALKGVSSVHWDMATELVAIEDSQSKIRKAVNRNPDDPEVAAAEIEPAGPGAALESPIGDQETPRL